GHAGEEPQSPAGSCPWRRLCARARLVGDARGDPSCRIRRLQDHLDRLPHAARFSLPGSDGRRDGSVEDRGYDGRPEEHGNLRHLDCGGMTLAMVLRAKDEHLPLPAAIAPGTPWSDLTDTGDSYKTNEWVDNILVTWNGWLGDAAKLYAGRHDLKEPYLSPIYGDFHGFPPAILTTGTRALFLSNTVRTHRKLRRAGVEADLNVYEGQSHAEYYVDPDAPETKEAMTDIANFFDKHLGK